LKYAIAKNNSKGIEAPAIELLRQPKRNYVWHPLEDILQSCTVHLNWRCLLRQSKSERTLRQVSKDLEKNQSDGA